MSDTSVPDPIEGPTTSKTSSARLRKSSTTSNHTEGNGQGSSRCCGCEKVAAEMIECEYCKKWMCLQCAGLTINCLKFIQKFEEVIRFYCKGCTKIVKDILHKSKTGARSESHTSRKLQKLEIQIGSIEKQLSEIMTESKKATKTYAEIAQEMQKKPQATFQPAKEEIKQIVTQAVQQADKSRDDRAKNRDARKNNLILFNVPESQEADLSHRKKADIVTFGEICESIMDDFEFQEKDVSNVLRLGPKKDNNRPLLVTLTCEEMKRSILRNAYKIRQDDHIFNGVNISQDMTPEERAETKKLVQEAKELEANDQSGNFLYRVRGPPWAKYIARIWKERFLECFYTNADSLMNKMDEFKARINFSMPQIIGVTEVKPKNSRYMFAQAEIAVSPYDMTSANLNSSNGRGIILYTHASLNATPVSMNFDFEESVWAEVKLGRADKLLVGCIYRSPNSTSANNEKLLHLLDSLKNLKYTHILIMGDFNYPDIDWSTCRTQSKDSNDFIDQTRDSFLFQHVNTPTRARENTNSNTLDLIFTNEPAMIQCLDNNSPIGKSDHSVLTFKYMCYNSKDREDVKRVFNYNKAKWEDMQSELCRIQWDEELHSMDIHQQWCFFKDTLFKLQEKYVPKKTSSTRLQHRWAFPINPELRHKIRQKNTAWRRFTESRDDVKRKDYNRKRNQVRKETRILRKQFERKIAGEIKRNPKSFWRYIGSKTKTRDSVAHLVNTLNNSSELTKNDSEKAQILADFFSSVFTEESNEDLPEAPRVEVNVIMPNLVISSEEVSELLKNLDIHKSAGIDNIHPIVLKRLAGPLSLPLTRMFQESIVSGKLPQDWKNARITAIFKKGDRKQPSNYRPVSLTSVVCKTLEKIVRDHIIKHMDDNNLFSPQQFGFIKGRSTTLQLLRVVNAWTEALDNGFDVDVIYMDFMKAFDKVPHRHLIHKLHSYGISPVILNWIESFLTGRRQQVYVNGCTSSWNKVTSGIPQGSVLGPLLFIIYINDIVESLQSSIFLFADDTKIFRIIKNNPDDNEVLQRDIDKLINWSNRWLLKFHPDKCKAMKISNKATNKFNYTLECDNTRVPISYTDTEVDIGVTLDSKLEFEKHIMQKINKATIMFAVIRRAFKFLDIATFRPLYKVLVRSHLEYATSVWSPYKAKYIEALEKVQRRATKQVPGLKGLSYEERLKKLELPTLSFRRTRGDMIEIYKILNNVYDKRVTDFLRCRKKESQKYFLRGHDSMLEHQYSRTNVRNYSFIIRATKIWNSLPQQVINAPSLNTFKGRLDKHWTNHRLRFSYRD